MRLFQKWKQTALHNKALVLTGVIVAVGTLFYAAAAAFQVYMLHRSGEQATQQTERLITEANRIADSIERVLDQGRLAMEESTRQSKEALDESIKASRLDQRAWVGIKTMRVLTLEADKPILIEAVITNTGKTFASNTRVLTSVAVRPSNEPIDIDKLAASLKRRTRLQERPAVLFPNLEATLPVSTPIPITKEHLVLIRASKLLIYLFGEVHYSDVFGSSHTTEFCGIYNTTTKQFGSCSQHNRAN